MEDIRKIPIGAVMEHDTGLYTLIVIDRESLRPYCEECDSFDCIHVKYLMASEVARKNYHDYLKMICKECGYFNLKGSKFCIMCGTPLEDDKQ